MSIEDDLARNFGFDITMSDGSMGLPSAVHKEYMERCHFLYKEFITNMGVHMKTEKLLRKELRALHKEKIQHLRFSLYRSATSDPFARPEVHSSSSMLLDSRNNTPWGLNTVSDKDDSVFRPQTAPVGNNRKLDMISERPKTAEVGTHQVIDEDDDKSDSDLSEISQVSKTTVVGVMDRKTELSSSRKITVGKASFNKISHGKVRAKLKHKDGRFIVKPVRTDFEDIPDQDTLAFDPSLSKKQYDPVHERLALVRKITDFRTPTISSDMKINNRVPIQKSLRGINAKRTTVSEIYQNARERKARHFRIVSVVPRSKSAMGAKENSALLAKQFITNLRSKTALQGRDLNSQSPSAYGGSRDGTPLFRQRMHSQKDEIDSVASVNQARPRSILLSNSSGGKSPNDSCNAKEMAFNAFLGIPRPQSKVAFARSDSQASGSVYLQPNNENVDLSASFASSTGTGRQFGDKLNISINSGNRQRSVSGTSDITAISASAENQTISASAENQAIFDNLMSPSGTEVSPRPRIGLSASDLKARGLVRAESRQSLSSAATSNSFLEKLQKATHQKGKQGGPPVQKLAFQAPVKMESRKDTVDIVRQQLRQDKQLDERMTVWRRRMAVKSSVMSHRNMGGRLKMK
ncbi:uncharacterized protein LOC123538467 [Mercenaria mercenaria]|uniref:uncharacterized protein LOC123538467 n=1 Tax=Mercenaria mercenaria TaxID=6596 RepID=UPI00234F4B24|nr:uncharacterized protein LOC123538467 [Mercenaria mercenaria]